MTKNLSYLFIEMASHKKGYFMQEPKEDKESKVLFNLVTKEKRLLLKSKARRLKGMDA